MSVGRSSLTAYRLPRTLIAAMLWQLGTASGLSIPESSIMLLDSPSEATRSADVMDGFTSTPAAASAGRAPVVAFNDSKIRLSDTELDTMLEACEVCKGAGQMGCKVGSCEGDGIGHAQKCWCSDSYEECPREYIECLRLFPPVDSKWEEMEAKRRELAKQAERIEDAVEEMRKSIFQAEQAMREQREADFAAVEAVKTAHEKGLRGLSSDEEVDVLVRSCRRLSIPLSPDAEEARAKVRKARDRNAGNETETLVELAAGELYERNERHGVTKDEAKASIHAVGLDLRRAEMLLLANLLKRELGGSNRTNIRALDEAGGDLTRARMWLVSRTVGMNNVRQADFNCEARVAKPCAIDASDRDQRHKIRDECPDFGSPPKYRPGTGEVEPGSFGGVTTSEQTVLLEVHNAARAKHCAAALTWDEDLAKRAQKFADTCPCGTSSADYREGVGESIGWGYLTAREVAEAWSDEESDFASFDDGGHHSSGVISHFTAMVWKSTTSIGCGFRQGCTSPAWHAPAEWRLPSSEGVYSRVWVCYYSPHGNDPIQNCPPRQQCQEVLSPDACT